MKPHFRRVQAWEGGKFQWGWAVTTGWWTAWGKDVRAACAAFAKLAKKYGRPS